MKQSSVSFAFSVCLPAAAALTAPASGQVPDGYYLVTAMQQPASVPYPGLGGLYVVHPRRVGSLMPVANLPPALTGAALPVQVAGASCVAMLPNGDALVGTIAPAGAPVELYQLTLSPGATAVVATPQTIVLGTAGGGGGGVAQIAVISATQVLVVGNQVPSLPALGAPAKMYLALVDLSVPIVSAVNLGPFTGTGSVQGLTFDPATATAYLALHDQGNPATTQIHAFSLAAPGTSRLVTSTQGNVTNLAWRPAGATWAGSLLATFKVGNNTNHALRMIDPATGLVTNLKNGWDELSAVAVEPTTGELALCGQQVTQSSATGGVHWFELSTRQLSPLANVPPAPLTRGVLTGIAAMAAPARYGQASGASAGFRWSLDPLPARLPWSGNALFFVDVAWPTAHPSASACMLSLGPAQLALPGLGVTLLVNPAAMVAVPPMTFDPERRRSVLPLPIPAGLQPWSCLYLQSAHLVNGALEATEGLRVPIL